MTESFYYADFKWNNHNSALMEHFYSMLQREEFVDITLSSGGKSINVHRLVLAASSHYFEELLKEPGPIIVILHDIQFSYIRLLVELLYKGEVVVPEDKLTSFRELVYTLQIKGFDHLHHEEDSDEELMNMIEIHADSSDQEDDEFLMDAEDFHHFMFPAIHVGSIESKVYQEPMEPASKQADEFLSGNQDPYSYPHRPHRCEKCGLDFMEKDHLVRHTSLQKSCGFVSSFRCLTCGNCFTKKCSAKKHLSQVHEISDATQLDAFILTIEPTFPCNQCNLHCKNRVGLKDHKQTAHSKISSVKHSFMGQ